jgi:hypothetical protein
MWFAHETWRSRFANLKPETAVEWGDQLEAHFYQAHTLSPSHGDKPDAREPFG